MAACGMLIARRWAPNWKSALACGIALRSAHSPCPASSCGKSAVFTPHAFNCLILRHGCNVSLPLASFTAMKRISRVSSSRSSRIISTWYVPGACEPDSKADKSAFPIPGLSSSTSSVLNVSLAYSVGEKPASARAMNIARRAGCTVLNAVVMTSTRLMQRDHKLARCNSPGLP